MEACMRLLHMRRYRINAGLYQDGQLYLYLGWQCAQCLSVAAVLEVGFCGWMEFGVGLIRVPEDVVAHGCSSGGASAMSRPERSCVGGLPQVFQVCPAICSIIHRALRT